MDPPAQLEEHNSVQSDGAELGQEDPDIMRPQSIGFECVVNPALCAHISNDIKGSKHCRTTYPSP